MFKPKFNCFLNPAKTKLAQLVLTQAVISSSSMCKRSGIPCELSNWRPHWLISDDTTFPWWEAGEATGGTSCNGAARWEATLFLNKVLIIYKKNHLCLFWLFIITSCKHRTEAWSSPAVSGSGPRCSRCSHRAGTCPASHS